MSRRNSNGMSGVADFHYRKAIDTIRRNNYENSNNTVISTSTIDAAALQADMARRFNLPGAVSNRPRRARGVNQSHQQQSETIICQCCNSYNIRSNETCSCCGFYLNSLILSAESLAQRRGLVPSLPQVAALTPQQWEDIEKNIKGRHEAFCPICMEGFSLGCEILLSCSHIFHKSCLQAFEKFMKNGELNCPICRTPNYQKKVTRLGSLAYRRHCVIRIQSIIRGYFGRLIYKKKLKQFYRDGKGNETKRKQYYESEFKLITTKINQNMVDRSEKVDHMLSSMDKTLFESRQLDTLFDHIMAERISNNNNNNNNGSNDFILDNDFNLNEQLLPSAIDKNDEQFLETNWIAIKSIANARGQNDCAICMLPVTNQIKQEIKKNVILSCSHVFHESCICNLERFVGNMNKRCPVCRSSYTRTHF
eukprot:gene4389-6206_t